MLIISIKLEGVTEFIFIENIIYTSLMKCKRIIRVVLALELYVMVVGIDMLIAFLSIINMIIDKLGIKQLPIVVCINSLLLYKCIVKFDIIKEKRLMINIMLIR